MSKSRRHPHHLPFTAAFALIQALREPAGVRETEARTDFRGGPDRQMEPFAFLPDSGDSFRPASHEEFRPDFLNPLSSDLPQNGNPKRKH
ncbi:hypothetical protein [Saccharibacillus deserti]|uniref:hypothetical protein n=1 Tax=Saccharibacillus deserti TaxID=1634444 RepID=UPI0015539532|nr:hypothetical protein [Saccharibacillus deserti]